MLPINFSTVMRVNKDGSGKTNIGPTGFRQLADIRVHKYGYGMPGLNFLDAKLVHHIKIKLNKMQITRFEVLIF